jgi:hypothetical protein
MTTTAAATAAAAAAGSAPPAFGGARQAPAAPETHAPKRQRRRFTLKRKQQTIAPEEEEPGKDDDDALSALLNNGAVSAGAAAASEDREEETEPTATRTKGRAKAVPRAQVDKELAIARRELQLKDDIIARLEKSVAKLERELAEERAEAKRFVHQVDGQKVSMMADLTYHMAKSHHSAMQTLQQSQQISAHVIGRSLGESLKRVTGMGDRVKALMPPMPHLAAPNAKALYHNEIAAFLQQRVHDSAAGKALLHQIDTAIAETQQTVADERKRIGPSTTTDELKDLHGALEELQLRLSALGYQRDMLATGLAEHERKRAAIPVPASPAAPTPASTATATATAAPAATTSPVPVAGPKTEKVTVRAKA